MSDASPSKPDPKPPAPRWKRLAQNLALFFGTLLVCAIGLELALRLAGYGNLETYQPDPVLYWKLQPNQQCFTKVGHKAVRINSQGTRGPEFSIAKPTNTFRILSLGDSRTFGWGLAEEETYSAVIEKKLNAREPGKRVEVINAGVNAWSYAQMLVYFREIGRNYAPDAVILSEANQWTQFSESNRPEFVKKFLWRVRLKNLLRRSAAYHYFIELKLKNFYERHRTRFIPVNPQTDTLFQAQQQADPNAVFRAAIQSLCELAKTNGIQPVLLFLPSEDEITATNTPALLEVKRAVASGLSIPLVDFREPARAAGHIRLYLEADPVHFNARGNTLIAEELVRALSPLLTRGQVGHP